MVVVVVAAAAGVVCWLLLLLLLSVLLVLLVLVLLGAAAFREVVVVVAFSMPYVAIRPHPRQGLKITSEGDLTSEVIDQKKLIDQCHGCLRTSFFLDFGPRGLRIFASWH